VTSLYAALSAVMLIVLAGLVVRARWATRTALGTGSDPRMERAVRVHANFVEYVPMALLLLLLAELNGLAPAALHAAGTVLLVSRALHAWGLSRESARSFGRFWGTLGTWLTVLALAVTLLVTALA
jgi:uncharacterized membrane protein YecN with MAPEG domain